MAKSLTPQPVIVTTICSLCDEPWEAHGDAPTTQDCIRLLKAKLALPRPNVIGWPTVPVYSGYRCSICGGWVSPNSSHMCNNGWWSTYTVNCSGAATVAGNFASTTGTVTLRRPDDGGDPTPVAA